MKSLSRMTLAAMVAAIALVALAVGVAGAHKAKSTNKFKLQAIVAVSSESAIFKGRVIADGQVSQDELQFQCIKRRLVKIIHSGVVIATGRTNKDGSWQIVGPLPPSGDEVIAKLVPDVLVNNENHRHTCAGARATRVTP